MKKIGKAIKEFTLDVFETFVITMFIFLTVYFLAFQPHEVNGQSMDGLDNFHDGQYILTDKLTYRFRNPERGDVVVFKYPLNPAYDYIKRIIGLPGESIELKNNTIYIYNNENPDGYIIDQSAFIDSDVLTEGRNFLQGGEKVDIPEDMYFVMGDNRSQSSDSRTWGFVPKEDLIGRSLFRYWPPNEMGIIKHPKI